MWYYIRIGLVLFAGWLELAVVASAMTPSIEATCALATVAMLICIALSIWIAHLTDGKGPDEFFQSLLRPRDGEAGEEPEEAR